jgi:hypothetical protein
MDRGDRSIRAPHGRLPATAILVLDAFHVLAFERVLGIQWRWIGSFRRQLVEHAVITIVRARRRRCFDAFARRLTVPVQYGRPQWHFRKPVVGFEPGLRRTIRRKPERRIEWWSAGGRPGRGLVLGCAGRFAIQFAGGWWHVRRPARRHFVRTERHSGCSDARRPAERWDSNAQHGRAERRRWRSIRSTGQQQRQPGRWRRRISE